MIQGSGVGVGVRRLIRQRLGRGVHGPCRGGTPGAARDIRGDRLPRHPLVLLRQPAHECVGRRQADHTVKRCEFARQDPQQRALARTIGADHADHIAGRHRHVEPLEKGAVGESAGEVGRDERRGHGVNRRIAAAARSATVYPVMRISASGCELSVTTTVPLPVAKFLLA
ncbi:Uncharacterised protein [Mycobacteroides abscessus subsp. abscessus]|nr:Uncharacterised protein [Mycobacteroides abscessus subsp. abscessus]